MLRKTDAMGNIMMSNIRMILLAAAVGTVSISLGGQGEVQAQSFGGSAATVNRPVLSGSVKCYRTSAKENSRGAAHTSQVRSQRGLAQLRPNARLAEAAARHACDMARRDHMTHVGSKNRRPSHRVRAAGYRQVIVAENIGKGFNSAEQVMRAWVGSGSHLSNILLPQVNDFGIGKAMAADGRTVYWAAVYAAHR